MGQRDRPEKSRRYEIPFDSLNGNTQGFARKRGIAISPVAQLPHKTLFHELAHVALGHTAEEDCEDGEHTPRSLREAEAEAVALLLCESLELPGADYCRGYIFSCQIKVCFPPFIQPIRIGSHYGKDFTLFGQNKIRAAFISYLIFACVMAFVIYLEYQATREIVIKGQEGTLTISEDRGSGPKSYNDYAGNIDSTNVLIRTKVDLKVGDSYPVLYDRNDLAAYARDSKWLFFGFRLGNKRESTLDIHIRDRGLLTFWWMVLMTAGLLIASYIQFRKIRKIRIIGTPSRNSELFAAKSSKPRRPGRLRRRNKKKP
jgi:hypothetical protein